MVVEVHTTGKPAVRGRALLISIALFLLACSLAIGMTWHRWADPLGDRVRPPTWEISFRPPRRFQPYTPEGWPQQDIRRFLAVTQQGTPAELAFWRIDDIRNEAASQIAEQVLKAWDLRGPVAPPSAEPIGPYDGKETRGPQGTTIVRAAVVNPTLALAVSLDVDTDVPIDDRFYHLFDLTCRSIELTGR
jgi:hypothetical protein